MARQAGLEPAARSLEGCCSILLSYWRLGGCVMLGEYAREYTPTLSSGSTGLGRIRGAGSGIVAHLHRFYIPPDWPVGDSVELPAEEARHAAKVLRLRTGDTVALFDGSGRLWEGAVSAVDKRAVTIAVEEASQVVRPAFGLTLILGQLLRRKTLEEAIANTLPLGVTAYRIFRGDHSDRAPTDPAQFTRTLIESCKQSGRAWLPSVTAYNNLDGALAEPAWDTLLVGSLEGVPVPLDRLISGRRAGLIIGPEGDLSSREQSLAASVGAVPFSLGPHTLRSEVAAAAGAALLQYHLLSSAGNGQESSPESDSTELSPVSDSPSPPR